jgi:hypothetical protein
MSINSIGSDIPIQVSFGGIGVSTLTQYGVLYGNNTAAVQATAVGTLGEVLTSNGAGMAPTFQPTGITPGAGAWTFIQTQVAASSANLIFNTGITSSFPTLCFVVNGVTSSIINDSFIFDCSTDGGSTFPTIFSGGVVYTNTSTGTWSTYGGSGGRGNISPALIQTSGAGYASVLYFFGSATSSADQRYSNQFNLPIVAGGSPYMGIGGSYNLSGSTYTTNAYRFSMLLGNIATGTITLYGVNNT